MPLYADPHTGTVTFHPDRKYRANDKQPSLREGLAAMDLLMQQLPATAANTIAMRVLAVRAGLPR